MEKSESLTFDDVLLKPRYSAFCPLKSNTNALYP